MNIELKNIKHARNLSEETNAFTATVYVDGKKAGDASNRGFGGSTDVYIYDKELREKVNNHFKSLPEVHNKKYNFTYQPSLDGHIDDLIEDDLLFKDVKRGMNKGIVFLEDGKMYDYRMKRGYKKALHEKPLIEQVRKKYPNGVILNTLTKERILELVKETR